MAQHRPDPRGDPHGRTGCWGVRKVRRHLITYVTDRAGHDLRYAIDSRKLKRVNWAGNPRCNSRRGIEKTVRWYLDNQEWMDNITSGEYEKYYEEMYRNR